MAKSLEEIDSITGWTPTEKKIQQGRWHIRIDNGEKNMDKASSI